MKQCSGGVVVVGIGLCWGLLCTSRKVLCCSRKSILLQQQRDTMYSAVVRVGFNRWLLLLLPGFRIPELNWSLQHCALLSRGAGTLHQLEPTNILHCTNSQLSTGAHLQGASAVSCSTLSSIWSSGAVQWRSQKAFPHFSQVSTAAIYLPLLYTVTVTV